MEVEKTDTDYAFDIQIQGVPFYLHEIKRANNNLFIIFLSVICCRHEAFIDKIFEH